ncbi:glycoside hydrolase family 6 protein [Novosphingobium mathurense]|uniref:Glucanase n=1 Tax=Novosphingobium mathurense TaxID=428990 RepID=A0A1U6IWN5_9SPHN|nr:glycoside hydrolase family 6 protein [Novosphingobium mathurense]SLK12416.1 endoglucanase [Novosphingobium mathurense]
MIRLLLALLLCASPLCARANEAEGRRLFVDPKSTTARIAERLAGQARRDALAMAGIPSASWFTDGTPERVERKVRALVDRAVARREVPVLVAYNIPYRDCALYSAGGAKDGAAYRAWIRGFAKGIGDREAIVILEPDGLGVIPWHRTLSEELENCRPEGLDERAADTRFELLRDAVLTLSELPNVGLYLDGTGSGWLTPAEAASRLIRADVARADGFFLNVSNYESDARLVPYARWVSDCIALVNRGGLEPRQCPAHDKGVDEAGFGASVARTDAAYNQLFGQLGVARDPGVQKRAVIDSSRNGRGGWSPPTGKYADAEVWCNPPGRGLGRRPTLESEEAYVDAYLWIKIPGESDGQCHRGHGGPADPERGVIAPPAGSWFAAQARELVENADPPLVAK